MYRCPECGYVGPVIIQTDEDIPPVPDSEDERG